MAVNEVARASQRATALARDGRNEAARNPALFIVLIIFYTTGVPVPTWLVLAIFSPRSIGTTGTRIPEHKNHKGHRCGKYDALPGGLGAPGTF